MNKQEYFQYCAASAPAPLNAQLVMDGTQVKLQTLPTVRELVAEKPRRARVFEKWGISYCCCIGDASLIEACHRLEVEPKEVLADLRASDSVPPVPRHALIFWQDAPLNHLAWHIESEHLPFVRSSLARVSYLAARVAQKHGEIYPELWELQALFEEFKTECEKHFAHQENALFPLIKHRPVVESAHLQSVVGNLRDELHFLQATLQTLRDWMAAFAAPATACNTYRVLLDALDELAIELSSDLNPEEELLFARMLQSSE